MRLFISIQFTDPMIDALEAFQSRLKASGVEGYYAARENLHLTLAFIGDYGTPDAVMDVIESVPFEPMPMKLYGMGNFGDLYWAGIEQNTELNHYVKRLRRALAEHHIPYDRKRFNPHITVLRKATYHGKTILPEVEPPQGEMVIEHISLMRSERGKHGMIYTEISVTSKR